MVLSVEQRVVKLAQKKDPLFFFLNDERCKLVHGLSSSLHRGSSSEHTLFRGSKMRAAGLRLMLGELIKGADLLKLTGA